MSKAKRGVRSKASRSQKRVTPTTKKSERVVVRPVGPSFPKGYTTLTPQAVTKFLSTLAAGYSPTLAAKEAGKLRTLFYELRGNDEDFAKQWDDAKAAGDQRLEDVATNRGAEGWNEPVFYRGDVVGHVRKFSDVLLMQQLNARLPDKYRQNVKVEAPEVAQSFAAAMEVAVRGAYLAGAAQERLK